MIMVFVFTTECISQCVLILVRLMLIYRVFYGIIGSDIAYWNVRFNMFQCLTLQRKKYSFQILMEHGMREIECTVFMFELHSCSSHSIENLQTIENLFKKILNLISYICNNACNLLISPFHEHYEWVKHVRKKDIYFHGDKRSKKVCMALYFLFTLETHMPQNHSGLHHSTLIFRFCPANINNLYWIKLGTCQWSKSDYSLGSIRVHLGWV